jgi:hypothetical protein
MHMTLAMLELNSEVDVTKETSDAVLKAFELLGGKVPLITPDELRWEGRPNPWGP